MVNQMAPGRHSQTETGDATKLQRNRAEKLKEAAKCGLCAEPTLAIYLCQASELPELSDPRKLRIKLDLYMRLWTLQPIAGGGRWLPDTLRAIYKMVAGGLAPRGRWRLRCPLRVKNKTAFLVLLLCILAIARIAAAEESKGLPQSGGSYRKGGAIMKLFSYLTLGRQALLDRALSIRDRRSVKSCT